MEPTPDPIPVNAEGDNGYTMEGLKTSITANAGAYTSLKTYQETYRVANYCIYHFAKCFVDEMTLDEIKALVKSSDDEIANVLFTKSQAFVPPKCHALEELDPKVAALVGDWTFRICAAAFINFNAKKRGRSFLTIYLPDRELVDNSYQIQIKLAKCLWDDNEREHRDWVERRRERFASRDEDKEYIFDAPPADKMRVFRNGLRSRNEIGGEFWDGTYFKEPFIKITKSGLANVSKLFEQNPDCSPAELLTVMDGCIDLFMTQEPPPESKHDDLWHVRRGIDLDFFVRHIPAICDELDISCPIDRVLG